MRLLLNIGYEKILLPADTNTDAIFRALAGAVILEEKPTDYSEPNKYAIKRTSSKLESPEFIDESQLVDDEEAAEMDIGELKQLNERYRKEGNEAREKLRELEEKVAILTGGDNG